MSAKDSQDLEFETYINGAPERGGESGSSDQRSQQASKEAGAVTPQGTPPADFTVRSVYDSRPVNGWDINVRASAELGAPGTTIIDVFTVPQNYTCVPRAWHHVLIPVPAGITRQNVRMSLRLNGADVPFNSAIPVGEISDELVRSFFVAGEFAVIGVAIITDVAFPAGAVAEVHMYGNLLQKTGVPTQFEIANPGQGLGRALDDMGVQPMQGAFRAQIMPTSPPSRRPAPLRPSAPTLTCPPGHRYMEVSVNGRREWRCVKIARL